MIPFRVGDSVKVEADTWFAGATGMVKDVYPESGTLMIELEEFGKRVPRGLVLPFAPSEVIPTSCQHPQVSEAELRRYINTRWDWNVVTPICPDCHEWLYAEDSMDGSIRIYVGEPKGAGE